MIDNVQKLLVQKCCKVLNESLEQYGSACWGDLAVYIVLRRIRKPLAEMLAAILALGVPPSELLCGVMKCQWLLLEAKLSGLSSGVAQQNLQDLKEIIEHFHYIETTIVQVSEQVWSRKLGKTEKRLESEQDARILLTALQQWHAHDKLKLLNYYKGLPVQAMAKIVDIKGASDAVVKVAMSPELGRVLAISEKSAVLTPDADDRCFIQLLVSHISRDCIAFTLKGVAKVERRKQFRLQPLEPVEVKLYQNKIMIGQARLLDLSLSYLGLELECQSTFEVDEMIDFSFQIEEDNMEGAAWVRAKREQHEQMILCLELIPDARVQRLLQQHVASLQRKIIQEIKQKFSVSA